jgi:hypothetical protein
MISNAKCQARLGDGQSTFSYLGKCVVRPLVDQMPIHPQKRCAIVPPMHLMRIP